MHIKWKFKKWNKKTNFKKYHEFQEENTDEAHFLFAQINIFYIKKLKCQLLNVLDVFLSL